MARIVVGVIRVWASCVALLSLVAEGNLFHSAGRNFVRHCLLCIAEFMSARISFCEYETLSPRVMGHVSYVKYPGFEMIVHSIKYADGCD